jgi:D-glycero-alpha-D-manno-heptose 1-phosphate guanylyltransferase
VEAIILAGGFGTRLASVLADCPKALAPVCGEPFLVLLLRRLSREGFRRVIVSTGHLGAQIEAELGARSDSLEVVISHESEPLGTGGAARIAMRLARENEVFVMNGDTWIDLNYETMLAAHCKRRSKATLAVVAAPDATRYGALEIENDAIVRFGEKSASGPGFISAGNYLLNRDIFDSFRLPARFSIEKEFFEAYLAELKPAVFRTEGKFIDIGVPEDLARAQRYLENERSSAGKSWIRSRVPE